jgi:hypothetical protein
MTRLVRNPDVAVTEVEGDTFLVEPSGNRVFYLDAVTSGIWRLLETPASRAEVFETLAEAFPDEPPDQIADDTAKVLDDMLEAGLVREEGQPPATSPAA